MPEWYGYTGRVLRVDLTKKEVKVEELRKDWARLYIGGAGIGARILWEELAPKTDPLSPKNILVVATGPFAGTPIPGSGNIFYTFKSPQTGAWAETRSGGSFGPKLKFAGFDFIIIKGKADKPVYLWVHDGTAEIKNAEHIWGKTVHETTDILLEEVGEPEASVACIGPAGEKLVKYAAIMNDYDRAAGRCGGGAVMGSKNLKAIVVSGEEEVHVADPDKFYEAVMEASDAMRNYFFQDSIGRLGTIGLVNGLNAAGALPTKNFATLHFPEADNISGETLAEKYLIKRRGCYACTINCGRYSWVPFGQFFAPPHEGPEYETADMMGAMTLTDNLEAIIRANYLCNNYGLDTISTGNTIAFAMELFERGIITEKDTGGLKLEWGNPEVLITLINQIAKREGFGDLLAEGTKRAAEKIGKGAEEFAVHVKGLEVPAHDPRGESRSFAIQYAVTPRGACHMHPNWAGAYDFIPLDNGLKPYGLPWPPPDKFAETGVNRGVAYRLLAIHGELAEMVGLCRFYLWGGEDYGLACMTPKRIATLYSTLTGFEISDVELMKAGERVWNLKRCFNVREGFTRKDDKLPKRLLEPVQTGPTKGQAVKNLEGLLDEAYEAFGWDKKTGIPTREKLEELGLKDVADELERQLGQLP
ncbi:aldehyde ferredoxin oxidoreductase family protein [Thermococcus sp. LS2]|uniref:aldehyde ferredoxin oxidoreductase family protein n=1 Tax=Thermococcus sp. LS2 TaxID=1638260 RepID=UPI00143A7CD5|nr:aldehyde ferredoxin oxidoreductase family protein [Thermococcus sp. LS2]NJE13168.1 aldehyde ferredoxin oxidoreductase [Thermococcus sp. LS2]